MPTWGRTRRAGPVRAEPRRRGGTAPAYQAQRDLVRIDIDRPADMWLLRRYGLPALYWHGMLRGRWLLIRDRVYDVTTYLRRHPGGASRIAAWCGKEATTAFDTEDGRGEHSTDAYADLEQYFIGLLS